MFHRYRNNARLHRGFHNILTAVMEMITLAEPKEVGIRMLGHDIALTITEVSDYEVEKWLSPYTIDNTELGFIQSEICMHNLCGEFEAVSMNLYSLRDRMPVRYRGTWQIIPDYRQFARIMAWKHDHTTSETLTLKAFQNTYGDLLGMRLHDQWILCDGSIPKIMVHIGNRLSDGQKFIDMIMRHVARYEQSTSRIFTR